MEYRPVKKTEKMVRSVLEMYPDARDSDDDLLLQYMAVCGIVLDSRERSIFKAMPSFESITRCRRKLQERGLYLAKPQIAAERQQRADVHKQEMLNWGK